MDVSHGQDLRHSLYTTLDGAFPKSIMPIGVEHNLKQEIRKKLRKVGWDTLFRPGEEWERTVGGFAIRALDTVYTAYGQNPWFWGVAWPAVLGAAAADFWPHVATPLERRAVAHDATKGHLNALFAAHATEGTDLLASLPAPVAVAAVAAALGRDRWGRLRDGNSMVEASSAASGATSSADHAPAMLALEDASRAPTAQSAEAAPGRYEPRHRERGGWWRGTEGSRWGDGWERGEWGASTWYGQDGWVVGNSTASQLEGWSGAERAPPPEAP